MLNVVMLSVIMLHVNMLSVIMLNVVMLSAECRGAKMSAYIKILCPQTLTAHLFIKQNKGVLIEQKILATYA